MKMEGYDNHLPTYPLPDIFLEYTYRDCQVDNVFHLEHDLTIEQSHLLLPIPHQTTQTAYRHANALDDPCEKGNRKKYK